MAFRPLNIDAHSTKFNSAASSDLLDIYEECIKDEVVENDSKVSPRTFSPSSFLCKRISWFRLRGTEPDIPENVDTGIQFTADIGTACHEMIQRRLSKSLGPEGWIEVSDFLQAQPIPFEYTITSRGFESLVEITDPPVRFACDGIIKMKGKYYLLEIKTSEFNSFTELVAPKPNHIDQIKCYCTLLGLSNVLFLYMDRQHGQTKCFEIQVTESEKQEILNTMKEIQRLAECNIAPPGLPTGHSHCTPNMCRYYKKCKEWGR